MKRRKKQTITEEPESLRTTVHTIPASPMRTCPHCEYTWMPRKEASRKCPDCMQPLLRYDAATCGCKFCRARRQAQVEVVA
jgi:rubrerythrin